MASRGLASLLILAAVCGVISAQVTTPTPPYTNLLITARGAAADQSLLYCVDTRNGMVQTLFNRNLGTLTDVTMDRDNTGLAVVFQGSQGSGVYFLERVGNTTTIHDACSLHATSPRLCSLELGSEDLWIAGTAMSLSFGRVGNLETASGCLIESENFPGFEVSKILIDRNEARVVLALNGKTGGAVYLHDSASVACSSTLTTLVGFITGLAQDPCSGGLLVATNNPNAPFCFLDSVCSPAQVTTFRFPPAVFPAGLAVDAIAFDARVSVNGIHLVWAVSGDRLFVLGWDSRKRTLIFPNPLLHYVLPFRNATAMSFEGDRDFLMTSTLPPRSNPMEGAMLHMRLGPAHAGHRYLIAASFGNQPPVPLPGNRWINLRSDPLLLLSASGQLPQVFEEFSGTTAPDGEVTGKVNPGKDWSTSLKGVTLYFAGVVLDSKSPGNIRTVTNSVGLMLF